MLTFPIINVKNIVIYESWANLDTSQVYCCFKAGRWKRSKGFAAWFETAPRLRCLQIWTINFIVIFQPNLNLYSFLVEMHSSEVVSCTKPHCMNFAVKMFSSRLQLISFPALFFIFHHNPPAENAIKSKHWRARMNFQGCHTFVWNSQLTHY